MALGENPSQQPLRGGDGGENANTQDIDTGEPPAPPRATLRLWQEVAHGIDKSSTVVWKNAVDSLDQASRYLLTSSDAQIFVESYMKPVISILLEQQPAKIGQMEKECVEKSLRLAVIIVNESLKAKADESEGECTVLEVLAMIFNRKKIFYKGPKPSWNVNPIGLPEVRTQMISKFRALRGFSNLATYLSARTTTPQFPSLDMLHQLLGATFEAIPQHGNVPDQAQAAKVRVMEDNTIRVARAVMDFMGSASEEQLKRQPHESLNMVRYDLQRIFDRLVSSRRAETYAFYEFWRGLTLKLITSQSLPLKLFGWEQVTELIEASNDMRPPPKAFLVSGAGCPFVNGRYDFVGNKTDDGFFRPGSELSYEMKIPTTVPEKDGGGKTLTLFRCTMRSQQKWWFLSEADEEQPGTDKDIDYYQHKSKTHEEAEPPSYGWVTCQKESGVDPPPTLRSTGLVVPAGEEYNTLDHQLAKWAIKNGVIELVLGDSVHREVVARSTHLIKFLAGMCERDEPLEDASATPNEYCLKPSHLLLAWKTCMSKADAAVSDEVYQLLVSILPSLPNDLAIPLIHAVQNSLKVGSDKKDHLFEVAEFCSALASSNPMDLDTNSGASANALSDEVRAGVLKLLWSVLTHPNASSLKCYEDLKAYVTNELRVEPIGRVHRETFLGSCKETLTANAQIAGKNEAASPIDEVLALRMVKLTRFVLEACPRDQAVILVTADNAALAVLLFRELTAYLKRRFASLSAPQLKKQLSSTSSADNHHPVALSERLHILRYAYGLSDRAHMSSQQLDHLWALCGVPGDREALMVFLANASNSEIGPSALVNDTSLHTQSLTHSKQPLLAAYSDEVRVYAFQNLFCASSVDWEQLGEGAYQSFQLLFKSLEKETLSSLTYQGPALDALWKICLEAGNDDVASQAMKDLLTVYSAIANTKRQTPNAWNKGKVGMAQGNSMESLAQRVFQCLVRVKEGLEAGEPASERSAERCLRILNASIGNNSSGESSIDSTPAGAVAFAPSVPDPSSASVTEVLRTVPHGMRGQACYRTIGVMAKRTPTQNQVVSGTAAAPPVPPVRDEAGNLVVCQTNGASTQAPKPSSFRFSLDIHPLETLSSIKAKVAKFCEHPVSLVTPLTVSGRRATAGTRMSAGETAQMSLTSVPHDSLVAHLGITDGCELVFGLFSHPLPPNTGASGGKSSAKKNQHLDLAELFSGDGSHAAADKFFETLMDVLEALPSKENGVKASLSPTKFDAPRLVWDLLLSMPTNSGIVDRVRCAAQIGPTGIEVEANVEKPIDEDKMIVDEVRHDEEWSALLDCKCFHRSVYVMQVIDSLMQPAPEILSSLPSEVSAALETDMRGDATKFRKAFIDSGGFEAVLKFILGSAEGVDEKERNNRMGNAFALRVLKCGFFGSVNSGISGSIQHLSSSSLDSAGRELLSSLSDKSGLMRSITTAIVSDRGVSDAAVLDVLQLLRLLLLSDERTTEVFSSLPNKMAEKFLTTLLLWESEGNLTAAIVYAGSRIRRSTEELILMIPALSECALPWLIKALDDVDVTSEGTSEFFSVLRKLVEGHAHVNAGLSSKSQIHLPATSHLKDLATAVCKRLASHPRPTGDGALVDYSTGVLCGCLKLLCALIESCEGLSLREGADVLVQSVGGTPWSELLDSKDRKGMFSLLALPFQSLRRGMKKEDVALVDLMGAIFDGFLSSAGASSATSICCDKDSRQLGFDVVAAAMRNCDGGEGYLALVGRVRSIVAGASPSLLHRWGHNASPDDGGSARLSNTATKYSGLRNQGCTCYMNSVLQQLFMMPALRKSMCDAVLPSALRSSGGGMRAKGADLVGKKISLHWDSGVSYDANVEGFDEETGMHTIRYCPLQISTVGGAQGGGAGNVGQHHSQQIHPDYVAFLPDEMPDEFFLSEGRPGKETGAFELVPDGVMDESNSVERNDNAGESSEEGRSQPKTLPGGIEETADEASSRRLLEEVQRTFVHLDGCARGRCFDPRALVEASGCLKLEFDVWQQNDASEFAMKLLDRLEVPLKRWAPSHFKYLEHTFGLKQTKQKICKQCLLKTNREENLMNIDCQIRGKADIHEALSTMCEVEYMEGDNKVFCDRCKEKCDTVLRTAISALPDMLILSLKRFDLDYNTFETVKLNSRCAFGQTLNMKQYTLEGVEEMEKSNVDDSSADADTKMDTGENENDQPSSLNDEDYEYQLAGVLVHSGVAQGGHYYSFIKDRSRREGENTDRWFKFDDEEVKPFDPSLIEVECFGGKVKKETKWPNGQVHTVESEQFANALMLFYEKVKPAEYNDADEKQDDKEDSQIEEKDSDKKMALEATSGYDAFLPDVQRSNMTHSWHTFLFDDEFLYFLKGMLSLCSLTNAQESNQPESMDVSTPAASPLPSNAASSLLMPSPSSHEERVSSNWKLAVLQVSLSYVFDILLHSADKDAIAEWTKKLVDVLKINREGARSFVHELARRTKKVGANWLRVYCSECPEGISRLAALEIIAVAIQSCLSFSDEQDALRRWTHAWKAQVEDRERLIAGKRQHMSSMPTKLDGPWQSHEDDNNLEGASASSSIGIVISYLSLLLEVAPRTWRLNADLCLLIRKLGCISSEQGGQCIREAMIEAQLPARLICLAIREKSPPLLRAAFPGASVSLDVAEAMVKTETSPSSHLFLPGTAVGMGNNAAGANVSVPTALDHLNLLEALGSLMCIRGVERAHLVSEITEPPKGRAVLVLSQAAVDALSIIFNESKSLSGGGMGQRDIQNYMKRCGVDASSVPPHKISTILNKYPTISGMDGGKDTRYLSLEGFLAYYRDTAQTNEIQVRSDLHTFGFRPDLSRREEESRWYLAGNQGEHRRHPYQSTESVALDVALQFKNGRPVNLGRLSEIGLLSFHLYYLAYSACEPLAEYLLAASAYGKDTSRLLVESLKALSRAPSGWGGNETFRACLMIFKVLAALLDERQMDRITLLMQCADKAHSHADAGVGLLVAAKELSMARSSQHYSADYHYNSAFERYIEVIKELQKQREVNRWILEHRAQCAWMEPWLRADSGSSQQERGDLSVRRGSGTQQSSGSMNHHHSDSDMNAGMNDSEEDDEDSRYGQADHYSERSLHVQNAGVSAVNGKYIRSGSCDEVSKYRKIGVWNDQDVEFSLFRCRLSDHTKRWYISIVPKGIQPGTNKDIDFYAAPVSSENSDFPPESRWVTVKDHGADPPPVIIWKPENLPDGVEEPPDEDGRMWSGDGDDGIDDGVDDSGQIGFL